MTLVKETLRFFTQNANCAVCHSVSWTTQHAVTVEEGIAAISAMNGC